MQADPKMDFDRSIYTVRTWKSPFMLFWALNPFVAIDEFFLGRRAPKIILIGQGKEGAKKGVGYVPCPHCGTIHPGLEWSSQNHTLYKNWFGLYCKDCGKVIPCLYSVLSYVLLGLTFPVWYWSKDKWKARWLEKQRIRFAKPLDLEPPNFTWWKVGLRFGAWMYVMMVLIFPAIEGETITVHKLISGFAFFLVGGLVFGLMMKFMQGRRKQPVPISAPEPGVD